MKYTPLTLEEINYFVNQLGNAIKNRDWSLVDETKRYMTKKGISRDDRNKIDDEIRINNTQSNRKC